MTATSTFSWSMSQSLLRWGRASYFLSSGVRRHSLAVRHAIGLGRHTFQLDQSTDMFAIDEHLRHRELACHRADHARANRMSQRHFGITIAELRQQFFGARAIFAALARED